MLTRIRSLIVSVVMLVSVPASDVLAETLFWRHKLTGANGVWTYPQGQTNLTLAGFFTTLYDPAWEFAGSGNFNSPTGQKPDVLWQHQTGICAVWFMDGTNVLGYGYLSHGRPGAIWEIDAVADFNSDGHSDILWRERTYGNNVIWWMNGLNQQSETAIEPLNGAWLASEAGGIGDMNGDGKLDIVWRNRATGANAVWYMNLPSNPNKIGSDLLPALTDLDWKIVTVGHFNGDSSSDLIWRHATLGSQAVWFMNGPTMVGSGWLNHVLDSDWRVAGQSYADSTWRLTRTNAFGQANYGDFRATLTETPTPSIALSFNVAPSTSFGLTLNRRIVGTTNWSTLVTNYQGSGYADSPVSIGTHYEYEVLREFYTQPPLPPADNPNRRYRLLSGIKVPEQHYRGRVLLVVDRTITNAISASLAQFENDLIGDGWNVTRIAGERHNDTSWTANTNGIVTLRQTIQGAYLQDTNNTRGIIIVGHVVVPYSGNLAADGHYCGPPPAGPDHRGAWSADLYYADVDGSWTGDIASLVNCEYPDNTNLPGDGKFDEDKVPSDLELWVGRVDFGRLPVFTSTSPTVSETILYQRYFDKNHRYRHKLAPCPVPDTAAAMGSWALDGNNDYIANHIIYENAREIMSAVAGDWLATGALTVRDASCQKAQPHLWGLSTGSGFFDRIHWALPSEHTSLEYKQSGHLISTVFSMFLGSYHGDFNASDNFLRSAISASDYGLATVWCGRDQVESRWRLGGMAMGETLGDCLQRTVNTKVREDDEVRARYHDVIGDPTLRLHAVAPPTSLNWAPSGGGIQLNWTASTDSGVTYHVYRASTMTSGFTRLTTSRPISGTSYSYGSHTGTWVYKVRGVKLITTGSGSYTNISQGNFVTISYP